MLRAAILTLVMTATIAHAETPWEQGVPADQQAKANALFAEGNQLFAREAHAPALEKYRAAVKLWNHPLIHFNLAVALIRLDRVLEAALDLDAALQFGERPFTPELYRQAIDYKKLIANQLGVINAKCDRGRVTLDGKPWFECPGDQSTRVLGGVHMLVTEAAGYLTLSRQLTVVGGTTVTERLVLEPRTGHPQRWYQRWYVVGIAGALVAGAIGTTIYFTTREPADQIPIRGSTIQ